MSGRFKYYDFKKWIYKHSSSSTNNDLAKTVSKSLPKTNILLYSYMQTDGKGQIGRKWYSGSNNNLTMSLLFPIKQLEANKQFQLNMIFSLALFDWVEGILGKGTSIKWPNDIYYEDQKLAGLLIQNTLKESTIAKMMVGIGMNVNEKIFPKDLPNPISLFQILHKTFDLTDLIVDMLKTLEDRIAHYDQLLISELEAVYISKLYQLGKETDYKILTPEVKQISGRIVGVNKIGLLCIENKEGIHYFNFREISYN